MIRTIEVQSELEFLLIDQAIVMARELERVSDAALDGQILPVSELAALRAGCELNRIALEAALQRQSAPAEKKGLPAEPAPVVGRAGAKIRHHARR